MEHKTKAISELPRETDTNSQRDKSRVVTRGKGFVKGTGSQICGDRRFDFGR